MPEPVTVAGLDDPFHYGGTCLWTSEQFPYLEPYTNRHRNKLIVWFGHEGIKVPPAKDGLFILRRDFTFVWRRANGEWYKMIIPAGFITDIASVPWIVEVLGISRDGRIRTAAMPHDLGYQIKELMERVPVVYKWVAEHGRYVHDRRIWPKRAWDKFFAKVMKAYRTPLSRTTYWGVRLGGWFAWWRNDPAATYTSALLNMKARERARLWETRA